MQVSGPRRRVARLLFAGLILIGVAIVLVRAFGPSPAPSRRLQPRDYVPGRLVYPIAFDPGSGCAQLYATPFGYLWAREADAREMEIVIRELSPESTHSYERDAVFIRHGDVVIDAGANIGAFTRIALLRGARKVIAFEPQPAVIACYRRTFAAELASRQVILLEKGVWEQSGTLEFENDGLNFHAHGLGLHGLPPERKNATHLPATTIDETIEGLGVDRVDFIKVDFIKMDIEGSERYALKGARRTIAKHKPNMAITVYHRIDDPQVIPAVVVDIRPDYAVVPGPQPEGGPGKPGTLVFFPRDRSALP